MAHNKMSDIDVDDDQDLTSDDEVEEDIEAEGEIEEIKEEQIINTNVTQDNSEKNEDEVEEEKDIEYEGLEENEQETESESGEDNDNEKDMHEDVISTDKLKRIRDYRNKDLKRIGLYTFIAAISFDYDHQVKGAKPLINITDEKNIYEVIKNSILQNRFPFLIKKEDQFIGISYNRSIQYYFDIVEDFIR